MDIQDWVFYVLDLAIFVMLVKWLLNSREIEIETKVGVKWLIPALFLVVAVIGWLRYTGVFKVVQTVCLVVFAVMYYNVKSGLSQKGIIMMGSLTTWKKAGKVTLDKDDECIHFKTRGKDGVLYFDSDQLKEVREYLARRAGK